MDSGAWGAGKIGLALTKVIGNPEFLEAGERQLRLNVRDLQLGIRLAVNERTRHTSKRLLKIKLFSRHPGSNLNYFGRFVRDAEF